MKTLIKISESVRVVLTAFAFVGIVMLFNCAAWL